MKSGKHARAPSSRRVFGREWIAIDRASPFADLIGLTVSSAVSGLQPFAGDDIAGKLASQRVLAVSGLQRPAMRETGQMPIISPYFRR